MARGRIRARFAEKATDPPGGGEGRHIVIKNREVAFSFESDSPFIERLTGIEQLGINERGVFVVSGYTTPKVAPGKPRGSCFTTIPISPPAYRAQHPTRTRFDRNGSVFTVYTDYGSPCRIICDAADVLDELERDCVLAHIPRPWPVPAARSDTEIDADRRKLKRERDENESDWDGPEPLYSPGDD